MEDLRGEMEMVNSKSEEEEDEKEWEGEEGSVYDFGSFPVLFPISLFLFFPCCSTWYREHEERVCVGCFESRTLREDVRVPFIMAWRKSPGYAIKKVFNQHTSGGASTARSTTSSYVPGCYRILPHPL